MNEGISLVVVPLLWVEDMATSMEFYGRLGFETVDVWKPNDRPMWCSLKFGDAELMLQQSEGEIGLAEQESVTSEIELYFVCSDVELLYQSYVSNGLKVSKPRTAFYPMKQIFLQDPDGRTLCFETPVPAQNND